MYYTRSMAIINLKDGGTFWTLVDSVFGRALQREPGQQDAGGGGSSGAGQAVTPDTALKISAVWACVKLNAEAVGAMPIRVWTINSDGTRSLNTTHWLHRLFTQSPNRYQTPNEFFESMVINLMLAGNMYGKFNRKSDGSIISIMPMMAPQTTVDLTDNGTRRYTFTEGGKEQKASQEQVWHVPLMPSNTVVGLSPIEYGAQTMGIAIAAENSVANLAATGFQPRGVLSTDQTLTAGQRGQLKDSKTNAGRRAVQVNSVASDGLTVLEAGYKFQQISLSPKDVQLLDSRHFSIEDIARFYGTPSVLINDTTASTVWGSGIGEIKEGWYTLGLQPLLNKIEASVTKWLLSPEERGKIAIEFDFSAFLRGNQATRTETLTKGIAGNLITINEARATEGDPPVPGGDVMYAQAQMIPIGSEPPEGDEDEKQEPTDDQSL